MLHILKKFFILFGIILLSLLPKNLTAGGNDFGAGIVLGEPTGICFKYWVSGSSAIDGALAWSFVKESSFHLHLDYLLHNFNFIKTKKGNAPIYYGIGWRIKTEKKSRMSIRIPVGISYIFEKIPLDIFFELGPLLDLIPATEFGITANIGFRYYFK